MKLQKFLAQIEGVFDNSNLPDQSLGDDQVTSAVSFFFIIAGIISIIMVIIGGYWYTLSAGDPQKVKKAKDTILYAIIGLVI
jgi:hypothetical protein